jgi:hypothetical protein
MRKPKVNKNLLTLLVAREERSFLLLTIAGNNPIKIVERMFF